MNQIDKNHPSKLMTGTLACVFTTLMATAVYSGFNVVTLEPQAVSTVEKGMVLKADNEEPIVTINLSNAFLALVSGCSAGIAGRLLLHDARNLRKGPN